MTRYKFLRGKLFLPILPIMKKRPRKIRFSIRDDIFYDGRKIRWFGFRDLDRIRREIANARIAELKK